jgi:hypothetical protein
MEAAGDVGCIPAMLWDWGIPATGGHEHDADAARQLPTCINERSVLRRQRSDQTKECVLLLRLKLEKRPRYVEQHSRGPRIDRRIERSAIAIPGEEVRNGDVQSLCNGKKLGSRDLIDSLLEFVHLLSGDTESRCHLLLRHAGQQAQLSDPGPEEAVNIRTLSPAHCSALLWCGSLQVGARVGIEALHMGTPPRPGEFFAGVSGKLSNISEAHQRGLLAAVELGDLAINKEGSKLQVEHFRSHGASHGL